MRQRVDEIGGVCTIESRQGAGTTLKIKLPWSRKPAHHNN
jgi:signal transduction histidine kinase